MSKLSISVAIFVCAVVAGLGMWKLGVLPTSITDLKKFLTGSMDTSDWSTYRNEKYGYEIKYPRGADINGDKNSAGVGINLEDHLGIPQSLQKERKDAVASLFSISAGVSIEKINISESSSIRDWVIENMLNGSEPGRDMRESDVIFAGQPAYRLEVFRNGTGDGMYSADSVTNYFFYNGYVYRISVSYPPDPALGVVTEEWKSHPYYKYLEESVPITDAILASFRLLK